MNRITDMLSQKDFDTFRQIVREETQDIREDVSGLKRDVSGLKNDVSGLKKDVSKIKTDIVQMKSDIKDNLNLILSTQAKVDNLQLDVHNIKLDLVGKTRELSTHYTLIETIHLTHGKTMMMFDIELQKIKKRYGYPTSTEKP